MIRARVLKHESRASLLRAGEKMPAGGGAVSSVPVIDEHGLLRNGASPGLPKNCLRAIDHLRSNACVGTCAAAATTGTLVITPNFLADQKWTETAALVLGS